MDTHIRACRGTLRTVRCSSKIILSLWTAAAAAGAHHRQDLLVQERAAGDDDLQPARATATPPAVMRASKLHVNISRAWFLSNYLLESRSR